MYCEHREAADEMENMKKEQSKRVIMVVINESEASYYSLINTLDKLSSSDNKYSFPVTGSDDVSLILLMAQPVPRSNSTSLISPLLGQAALYFFAFHGQEFVSSVQQLEKKVAIGILEKAKSICTSRGINAETILEVGDPKVAVCKAVENYNVNLLVLPQENLGILKGAFSWSVSDYCVRYAKCPVLVVKKPE